MALNITDLGWILARPCPCWPQFSYLQIGAWSGSQALIVDWWRVRTEPSWVAVSWLPDLSRAAATALGGLQAGTPPALSDLWGCCPLVLRFPFLSGDARGAGVDQQSLQDSHTEEGNR